MSKKYWKGFEELENSPEFKKQKKNEFKEDLPLVETFQKSAEIKSGRRDFLKTLGFSLTAATVAASCEIPVRKAIPYVIKPEEILPSVANYYASTFVNGSDFCNVLVKTREGRPIKIEGNDKSSLTEGGTSARAQASVVSLYDNARLKNPMVNGEKVNWKQLDNAAKNGIKGNTVLLTSSILSPTTKSIIDRFKSRYNAKVVTYEPISKTGILEANQQSFGQKVVPSYHFDKAQVIVGVDCDFLGAWVSPVEFTKDYIKNRKVDANSPVMSQHFQFEPLVTTTGAKADYRRSIKPSQVGAVLIELYNKVGGSGSSGVQFSEPVQQAITKAANALKNARGRALVVCGSNDVNAQLLTNAINNKIGSYGSTIDLNKPYIGFQGDDKAMDQLVKDMKAGRVNTLLINNVNPAYDYHTPQDFIDGLKKVGTSISFNDRINETEKHVNILAPDNHYLETWSDVELKKGHFGIIQPTIAPLFNTRAMAESLMRWSGMDDDYYAYLKNYWKSNIIGGGEAAWYQAVHDGVFEVPNRSTFEEPMFSGAFSGDANGAISRLKSKMGNANGIELALYESIGMGDGKYANNPFLQELPDPITKVCWENVAIVSRKMAKDNGWTDGAMMRTPTQDSTVISISANGQTIDLPVIVQPGLQDNVIGIALGYGRNKEVEGMNEKCASGANAYPLSMFDGQSRDFMVASGVSVNRKSEGYKVAQTQTHHTIDDKREIINETTLTDYKKNKWSGNYTGQKYHDEGWVDHHFVSLYPQHNDKLKQGHHWGMSVDLNSCTGCAACVISCNIENNVPIVGQEDMHRAHDMHWMRIDRYYASDPAVDADMEHPEVAFQPMMCQHCDNAPCENVCPVNASNHSSEGLNQMAYNRCIGTRYCANNCPFKVRRFNWFDYQGADSFYASTIFDNDEHVMIDNLTRMVLNPDVTVRSRGVMEKCSFCVQNLQSAKLEAKKEGRPLKDGEAQTACQTACPTNAIVFGDMNDPESQISKMNKNERSYNLLQDIHVLSSVSYMTGIRNKDNLEGKVHQLEYRPKHHHGDGHGGGHGDDHGHGKGHGGGHGHDDGHGKGHKKGGKDHGHDHKHDGKDHGHDHKH